MAQFRHFLILFLITLSVTSCKATGKKQIKPESHQNNDAGAFMTGAAQFDEYLPLVKGKKVVVVANQTSIVNGKHLVDQLLSKGVNLVKVFAPEHGFRGEAGPGDKVHGGKDAATGLEIVSLYGSRKKPTPDDLKDVDYVIFDIQDVGARFYTYISTLHYVMEACAENGVNVIILDRPNPNGYYVDGPVLDTSFRSFVGIAPIPIVHGLTVGEYGMMANGEGWLNGAVKCNLKVVKMKGYTHRMVYELPVRPSPNLPGMNAIYLYPSLCLFEGTAVSVGRGTAKPFEIIGFPGYSNGNFNFTPKEIPGVIKDPPYEDQECKGIDLSNEVSRLIASKHLMIEWLIDMYKAYPDKEKFFTNFFEKLSGTASLREQIKKGMSADMIRKSWQPELENYKAKRKKYLLYED